MREVCLAIDPRLGYDDEACDWFLPRLGYDDEAGYYSSSGL